ncbi:MAG: sugar ABC transporter permease [Clostridia bacterium]|nr:sugar ABC transporter permease [Clostridia bacterium]
MIIIDKHKRLGSKGALLFVVSILIIPVVHWLIFWLGVNINSILLAFKLPSGEWDTNLLVLKTVFKDLMDASSNEGLGLALRNTLLYFIKDVLMLPFQLCIAYFLYKKIAGYKAFQIILYLPGIVSGVAFANVFSNFIGASGPLSVLLGAEPLATFLKQCGIFEVPEFLANSQYATSTIMFYTIWMGWGGNMLLLCGALARVPVEILESARLDGINPLQELVHMILPLIWSTLSTLLILQMTKLFTASGPILLFTGGLYKTTTIGYWIFSKVAYQGAGAYNTVAATGLLFTLIGAPIILTIKWLIEKIPVVEY